PGRQFSVRRLFAARSLASAFSTHGSHKAALLHIAALDRHFAAALQSGVRPLPELFVEEKADVRRRNLVSRDVIAQLGIVLRLAECGAMVLTRHVASRHVWLLGQKQDAMPKLGLIRTLFNREDQRSGFNSQSLPRAAEAFSSVQLILRAQLSNPTRY